LKQVIRMIHYLARRAALIVGLMSISPLLNAQSFETDTAKYMRPIVLVMPDTPASLIGEGKVQKFVVSFRVDADGSIEGPMRLEPENADLRAALGEVTRFWLFYPDVSEDCKPVPRDGKISFEFDGSAKNPRVWAEFAKLKEFDPLRVNPRIAYRPPLPRYPHEELKRGLSGEVTIIMKVTRDGSVVDPVVLTAMPPNIHFAATARVHAKKHRATALEGDGPAHVCAIIPYGFRIER